MIHFLPAPLHGAFMMMVLIINTLFWATLVYAAILFKLLTPEGTVLRNRVSRMASSLAQQWAHCNGLAADTFMKIEWDIRIHTPLSKDGQYLVCCNHQTWNDIFVLLKAFGKKAPFFKFFLKQELIWVPVLGLVWWGLDYPFMKRYSKEQIEKNPALKGKDLETTIKACERYKGQPVMILNFLEGTRFTRAKHAQQQSPYTHLLKPKSGGFAFALGAMGQSLNSLLDVTIAYPQGAKGFWDFMAGRVTQVKVDIRQLTIPPDLYQGDYENDPVFRNRFQNWIGDLWREKDQRITQLLASRG